jgi:hypothetical protein
MTDGVSAGSAVTAPALLGEAARERVRGGGSPARKTAVLGGAIFALFLLAAMFGGAGDY